MPLMPNFIERTLFLTLNQGPGVALDLWSGPAHRFVLAAVRLDLFAALEPAPLEVDALATAMGTDPRGTRLLLAALEPLGYVKRSDDAYALTSMARKWLTDSGELNLSPVYRYWGTFIEEFFPQLEDSLRSGQPPVNLYAWLEEHPDVSEEFQTGLAVLTDFVKDDVLKHIALPSTARRLLDVGGGHGSYSIALCRRYPALEAVIVDSPQALASTPRFIEEAGLGQQIGLQQGDFLHDDLGSGYDAALLFNIIHGLSAGGNIALLHRLKAALNPGGHLFILDQVPGASPLPVGEATTRILGLSFFHLLGGQIYSLGEIGRWLEEVGFINIRQKKIAKASSALIVAESGGLPRT